MNTEFWNEQWSVIEAAIEEVKSALAVDDPNLRWTSGHWGPQEVFPFRAYASVELDHSDDDRESVDFSVDCKLEGERLRITSDICYSDGQIIVEGPVAEEPTGVDREEWIRRQIRAAADFFRSTAEQVGAAIRTV